MVVARSRVVIWRWALLGVHCRECRRRNVDSWREPSYHSRDIFFLSVAVCRCVLAAVGLCGLVGPKNWRRAPREMWAKTNILEENIL